MVKLEDGTKTHPPDGWILLKPGDGTLEERAERAVIAWMRHQTTAYDDMRIARIKGKRRQVRQQLARRSRDLLAAYRSGDGGPEDCPLRRALS